MPSALYRCRRCGESYVLSVMRVLRTVVLGSPVCLGGAPHGKDKSCRGKLFDLVGDVDE